MAMFFQPPRRFDEMQGMPAVQPEAGMPARPIIQNPTGAFVAQPQQQMMMADARPQMERMQRAVTFAPPADNRFLIGRDWRNKWGNALMMAGAGMQGNLPQYMQTKALIDDAKRQRETEDQRRRQVEDAMAFVSDPENTDSFEMKLRTLASMLPADQGLGMLSEYLTSQLETPETRYRTRALEQDESQFGRTLEESARERTSREGIARRELGLGYAKLNAEREAAEGAAETAREQGLTYANDALTAVNRALPMARQLGATGTFSGPLAALGGTPAANLRAQLDTIESYVSFDRLQAMRNASPTGGALGSVTENELRLLASTIASLRQSQSSDELQRGLIILKRRLNETIHGRSQGSGTAPQRPRGVPASARWNPSTRSWDE